MITEADDFFTRGCGRCARFDTADCSAVAWRAGLVDLRRLCREAGLVEAVKWGHPCYMHAGRNVALIGAVRGDFRLNFFHAALLSDPAGVLERQGANTEHRDMMRFTDAGRVADMADTIRAYLAEAMRHAEAGTLPVKEDRPLELPEELQQALDADPALGAAFAALTSGRQRSYAIALSSAKAAETRRRRVDGFRPKILAGKGAAER